MGSGPARSSPGPPEPAPAPPGPHRRGLTEHSRGSRLSRLGGGRRRGLPWRGLRTGLSGPWRRGPARFPGGCGVGGPAFFAQVRHGDAQGPGHCDGLRQHLRPHGVVVPGIFHPHAFRHRGGDPDPRAGADHYGGRLRLPHLRRRSAGTARAPADPGILPEGYSRL